MKTLNYITKTGANKMEKFIEILATAADYFAKAMNPFGFI